MTRSRAAAAVLLATTGGCVLPAFSAGEGEGGGATSTATTTSTTTGTSGTTTTSSSSDAGGGPSTGGGAGGGDGGAGQGGGCGDTASDPENCGRCGVSCMGAACGDGVCEPFLMTEAALAHGHLAVGADHVWWTSPDLVAWVDKRSLVPVDPQTLAYTSADMIAADAEAAYFTTSLGNVVKLTPDGAASLLGSGYQGPIGIVVADGLAYWTVYYEDLGVFTAPTSGDESAVLTSLPVVKGIQVAADGGSHFFVSYHGNGLADGGVLRSDGLSAHLSAHHKPSGVAVSTSHVYWLDEDGSLWRRRRDLIGGEERIAPPHVSGRSTIYNGEVATDTTHVYWTSPSAVGVDGDCPECGAVYRAALGSGATPEVFVHNAKSVNGLAVDDVAVYWTTTEPDGVWRKVKP